jgi:glucose/arabinose dehydrogenase
MVSPRRLLVAVFFSVSLLASAINLQPLPGTWTDALTLASLPDGSLLVAQKSGMVDRLPLLGDEYGQPLPWADLGGGDEELVGLAVDPEFLSSGYVFATLRSQDKATVRVTRWRDSGGLVVLNRTLVDLPSGPSQAGGVLKIGPDGKLWVGLGDGGVAAAEVKAENLRGVLLRYNLDGSIPEDNPSPTSPVWSSGLRDPSGLAWQPETGRLYALDRGPAIPRGTMDEVNLIEKSGFYGWPKHLGREVVKGVVKPVIYCSSGHTWVPGGAVFATSGEWKGSLLFAGAGEGVLYRLSLDTRTPTKILFYEELVNGSRGPLVDVARGPDDQLYLLSETTLFRIAP